MSQTISFLPELDKASDTRKINVCKNWPSAIKGDFVFIENVMKFNEGKGFLQYVQINCALVFPKVFYTFEIHDGTVGRFSLPCEYDSNFDVHECLANIMLMVEHALRDACSGYKVKESYIKGALLKMGKSLKED